MKKLNLNANGEDLVKQLDDGLSQETQSAIDKYDETGEWDYSRRDNRINMQHYNELLDKYFTELSSYLTLGDYESSNQAIQHVTEMTNGKIAPSYGTLKYITRILGIDNWDEFIEKKRRRK